MNKNIVVIGSGIAGLTAAYFLAKEGNHVTIFEKENGSAQKCSRANGGQISVSNSETWNTWSNIRKGISWILKKDAPLLIRPDLDFDKAIWLTKFLYHTANNDYAKNTIKTIRMGIHSRQVMKKLVEEENIIYDQQYNGILHFYKNKEYFANAKNAQKMYEDNGCDWSILNTDQVYEIDPALKDVKDVIGGVYTSSDWTGDIYKFCKSLEKVLVEKYNVEILYDFEYLFASNRLYDLTVLAAGVDSIKFAKLIGDKLPIYPVKGYSITITGNDETSLRAMPKVSLLDDQAKIVTSFLGNRLRVAGTAELAGHNYEINKDRIQPLVKWVENNFPDVDCSTYEEYACLRPMTPNMMPIVRQSKVRPDVWYHTGHGHLGWTLSAGTAYNLASEIKNHLY